MVKTARRANTSVRHCSSPFFDVCMKILLLIIYRIVWYNNEKSWVCQNLGGGGGDMSASKSCGGDRRPCVQQTLNLCRSWFCTLCPLSSWCTFRFEVLDLFGEFWFYLVNLVSARVDYSIILQKNWEKDGGWITAFVLCIYYMKSMKIIIPSHFITWKNSFSDISRKGIRPNMIRAKLWTALIIFSKIHFLLISENEVFLEIKPDGMTSFENFMTIVSIINLIAACDLIVTHVWEKLLTNCSSEIRNSWFPPFCKLPQIRLSHILLWCWVYPLHGV